MGDLIRQILDSIKQVADGGATYVLQWPPLGATVSAVLIACLFVALAHAALVARAAKWGDRLSEEAIKQLKNEIRSRVRGASYVSLATVYRLAHETQTKLQSPVLTHPMMGEALRRAILEAETPDVLNSVLTTQDAARLPLLSIANVNRMLAYVISATAAGLVIVYAQFLLTSYPLDLTTLLAGIGALALALIALLLMDLRAIRFWRGHYQRLLSPHQPVVIDARPPRFRDFFVFAAHSEGGWIHTVWGPFWEEVVMRLLLVPGVPILAAWITVQIGRYLLWDDAYLRNFIVIELIALVVILGPTWGTGRFLKWHEYKYWEVAKLKARLEKLDRSIALDEIGARRLPANFRDEYLSVCNNLWAITGAELYEDYRRRERLMRQQIAAARVS